MKANVYIDGFNLYYRALKGTPFKWLNILELCKLAFPKLTIHRIRYFTAIVNTVDRATRQQTLIRALTTLPNFQVHYGTFLTNPITRPLVRPIAGLPKFVEVFDSKEKGSDVNLATYLLLDAFRNDFEYAIVISNGSDLAEPIQVVKDILKKPVIVFCPCDPISAQLRTAATYCKSIRKGVLAAAQLPATLTDAHGTITKPKEW